MDENPFLIHKELAAASNTEAPVRKLKWWNRVPSKLPLVLLILLFVGIVAKPRSKNVETSAPRGIVVLVPLQTLPAKSKMSIAYFRETEIPFKQLSPSQRRKIVRTDEMKRLEGRISSKNILPIDAPLMWSDLKIETVQPIQGGQQRVKIHGPNLTPGGN